MWFFGAAFLIFSGLFVVDVSVLGRFTCKENREHGQRLPVEHGVGGERDSCETCIGIPRAAKNPSGYCPKGFVVSIKTSEKSD